MNNKLFDQQNLSVVEFVVKPEEFTQEVKSKKYLVAEESCDGFFETLQGKLRNRENSGSLNPEDLRLDMSDCKLVFKSLNILGEYYPEHKHIKYYKQTPKTLEIVKIHERFHAIHHLMPDPDKNGSKWDDFADIDSFYLELLAQLFTFIYIQDFDETLMSDFEDLNREQPLIYKTYKIFRHYNMDQAEELYWAIREKNLNNFEYKLLVKIFNNMRIKAINNAVFDGIRKTINRFREQPFLYFTESDIHASLSKDIMDGSSDILILGNTAVERKSIKTPVSLVHHEFPTNFRYEKKKLKDGYDDENLNLTAISSAHGDRGNYDLAVLNPVFIEKLFESHKKEGLIEILKHIINKDLNRAINRIPDEELIYAIEVKFVHMFNDRNINMLEEVKSDNEKLRLALHHKHCTKAINLFFCSSAEKERRDIQQPVIRQIKEYIESFYNQDIINIFIESFIDLDSSVKKTTKPKFSKNQQGWSDLINVIVRP